MRKFKAYLVEHNIRQKEAADVVGISVQQLNRKLNGAEPFTLAQVKKLCEHYNISADEYFICSKSCS